MVRIRYSLEKIMGRSGERNFRRPKVGPLACRANKSKEQIAFALRQAGSGMPVEEVCRKIGASKATFYWWKQKFGGLGVSVVRRLKQLEEENRKLKQLVADLGLDRKMLQDVLSKKW